MGGDYVAQQPIRDIKNGDADLAESIVRENYKDIYKYCYWKVGSSEKAEDITQEVFLKFIKNIGCYSERGKPRAYLYTIAKNLCINEYKKCNREVLNSDEIIINSITGDIFENIVDKITLQKLIGELSKEQQEVILLRFGQGLKLGEIAIITDTTRFTVQYRIKKSLTILKKKLQEGGIDYEKRPTGEY
ncbi:RNA polymerase sigma factor [Clostridium novyi A str. BKT29909]|nr:RNA polymerase sigma factor [Clostridium novyi A str. BKT29909]